MNLFLCDIMLKEYGSLFNNMNSKYGWCLLNHKYKLPVDVLQLCLGYSPIPTIKLSITADDNSFKYIFKNELGRIICSVRRTFVDGPSIMHNKAETSYCDKYYGHELLVTLVMFVNRKTLVEAIMDYLTELRITNTDSLRIASDYLTSRRYPWPARASYLRRQTYVYSRKPVKPDLNANHLGNVLQCNTNWDLITTLCVNPKVALVNSNYNLNLYTDEDGITKWVCVRELVGSKRGICDRLRYTKGGTNGITKDTDYKYKKDIKFEDPESMNKKFKCKNTYFINLKSLANYLTICGSFQSKILAVWILRCMLEK